MEMSNRRKELEITNEDPFKQDALDREALVLDLCEKIELVTEPFVMMLNSPWGTGKTTLVRMMMAHMRKTGKIPYVYFNAWEVDWTKDPLYALVSTISQGDPSAQTRTHGFEEKIQNAKMITAYVSKRLTFGAIRRFTGIDADVELEKYIKEFDPQLISADMSGEFDSQQKLIQRLKQELADAVDNLDDCEEKQKKLVVFIDELDRCRPTFAVELLERIKHIFDLANIVFVLSIDESQLKECVKEIYGSGIEPTGYLRKFFDHRTDIRSTHKGSEGLVKSLLDRIAPEAIYNIDNETCFIRFFALYAGMMELGPREQEKSLEQIKTRFDQLSGGGAQKYILAAFLLAIHGKDPQIFGAFARSEKNFSDMAQLLSEYPGYRELPAEEKIRIDALLIFSQNDYPGRQINEILGGIGYGQHHEDDFAHRHSGKFSEVVRNLQINLVAPE